MTASTDDTAAFAASLSADQAAVLDEVHRTIAAVAPTLLPPVRDGAVLGYGPFHYRYASGREGDAFLVTVRGGSRHLSVYVTAAEGDAYVPEAYASTLGKVSVGRSCIRVRRAGELDLAVFGEVVRRAVELGGAGAV
ncbi:MAG: hypothetical protein K0S40_1943 [Actinomycetospora sp.]|jgi:hypothetical protein|nr:hypothetical protein [Actinomycetospora sp.]